MSTKIIRDPLYNYVSIDRKRDGWLVDVLDCPEVQRLRRIHQLGVSNVTYPGADHSRLAHSLGVLHLMQCVLGHLDRRYDDEQVNSARAPLLAAALLHDIGHGPFSHVFEPCLGVNHEEWSVKVLVSEETSVHRVLHKFANWLPRTVSELIEPKNQEHPPWQKYLLSSELDVDRLDYLRRDSLFSGADYGHYDWYRLANTPEFHDGDQTGRDIVWPEKSLLAIEEYIFSRYYMYQNVYLHKTTRGFEKMLEAMWKRARLLFDEGTDAALVQSIKNFWCASQPQPSQYLAIEEFSVLQQIQNWSTHSDSALSDLACRFLGRERFAMVEAPDFTGKLAPDYSEWERALLDLVSKKTEYQPAEMYCLVDRVKPKHNQPYNPEPERDEQSVKNAIRVSIDGQPVEVSTLLPRLKPVSEQPLGKVRYYIPKDLQSEARTLRTDWK
jgi:uncharacterized protein